MAIVLQSFGAFGLILGAQFFSDDNLRRFAEILGLVLLLINTYLGWRKDHPS